MDPLGLLGAMATDYFLSNMQAMWQRVITFLIVTPKLPTTNSEMPLFEPRIEWSLLAWTTTTLDPSLSSIHVVDPPDT